MGPNRGIDNLWSRLHAGLDDDERIVFPWMYEENRDLYDKLVGVAYLVRERHPNAQIDWVWENSLERVKREYDIEVLAKQYVVRVRLPWNSVHYEWLATQDELDSNRKDYKVLKVYLWARDLQTNMVGLINPLEYEEDPDRFQVTEARYLVCWKDFPSQVDIDPNKVHLTLGE